MLEASAANQLDRGRAMRQVKAGRVIGTGSRTLVLAIGAVLLAACGGGGGNSRPVSPPPAALPPAPPPPPPVVGTADPAFSKHLAVTNAYPALQAGLTGQGVAIGVVDSGVMRNHPALQGRVTHNLNYVSSPPNNLAVDDVVGHGTAVSLIMAGTPFGNWPGGVAPGASIISARIISDKRPDDDGTGQGNEVSGALGLGPIHQDLINRGARIMNNSWGGLYWTNLSATAPIAQEYRPFITTNNGLVVFATGNSSFANPSSMAALPSQPGTGGSRPAADLERGWLSVAALDTDNPTTLASYSNRCGVAMNYCLAAPGKVVTTGTNDGPNTPTYWTWTGTSLAAPLVSGAAALVWQAFPYFNNDLVRQTILGTATDLGAPGVDPVFGYGALNIGRAVQGPGRFDWGDVVASFAGTSTWGNDIVGAGGLVKGGSGTLLLTGNNSYMGNTRVQNGTLSFANDVPGNAWSESLGNLVLRGGVNGNLQNQGRVSVLGNAGSRAIAGDYVQGASATLGYQVGSPLAIAGTAQLAGTLQVVGVAPGYVRSANETVLTAAGGRTGTFATLNSAAGVFLQASAVYDSSSVSLNISRLDVAATAQSLAGATPMSLGAASRVETALSRIDEQQSGGGDARVSEGFLGMAGEFQRASTEEHARASLESLSGEVHATADAMTFDAIDSHRRALAGRFGEATRAGQTGGDWFERIGNGGRGFAGNGDFELQGWLAGRDVRLGAGTVAGLAAGEARAHNGFGSQGDSSRDRQTQGRLYLGHQSGKAYVLGQLGVGEYDRQVRRGLLVGQSRYQVASEYTGRFASVNLETGYRTGTEALALTPYLGVDHTRVSREGFNEVGANGFGLRTRDSVGERTQAIAGARAERQWQGPWQGVWTLRGYAEWQQALAASGFDVDASFVEVDSWSALLGGDAARSGGMFGLALGSRLGRNSALSLGYDQRFGPREGIRTVSLRYARGF